MFRFLFKFLILFLKSGSRTFEIPDWQGDAGFQWLAYPYFSESPPFLIDQNQKHYKFKHNILTGYGGP